MDALMARHVTRRLMPPRHGYLRWVVLLAGLGLVGLLFAGSSVVTVANHIENVRALLRVEIAEQLA